MTPLDKATEAMRNKHAEQAEHGLALNPRYARILARAALEAVVEDVATAISLGCRDDHGINAQFPSCDASYHRAEARRALGLNADGAEC